MKKIITYLFLAILIACSLPDPPADAGTWNGKSITKFNGSSVTKVCNGNVTVGCAASYGADAATTANATDDSGGSEADATTDWAGFSSGTIDSVTTAPYGGTTYHLICTAAGANQGCARTLTGLSASTVYKVSYWVRNDGTASATWSCGWCSAAGFPTYSIATVTAAETTYKQMVYYTLYNTQQDVVACYETNASNNGSVYIDSFSIKTATLCYGSELHTHANAARIVSETNAATGWTGIGTGAITSESDGSPQNGTYHLKFAASASNDGAYADIGTDFSLQAGTKYFIRFFSKGDGFNAFKWGFGSATDVNTQGGWVSLSTSKTYMENGYSFVYDANHRYLKIIENNASNTGYVYIDTISIKAITGE